MASAGFLKDMNDLRLKPRILRSLLRDLLPDEKRPFPTSSELSSVLSQVRIHNLLSELVPNPNPDSNPNLMEAWKSAVDEWLDRVISLMSSKMPDKCWAGICLLGVTCEGCNSDRFLASYSIWFDKLLSSFQLPSSTLFVKVASCASLADFFTRLASFSNLKKDATSFGGKLIQPILQLLNLDDAEAVWEGAVDLLCTIMTLIPSSVHRHYDNVESVLVAKMMAKSNSTISKKFAFCLALLPKVKGDEESWSLLMQKILIAINVRLNDAFQGLEEEARSFEIMRLVLPPGKDPPPPLGGHLISDASEQATKKLREMLVPRVSSLMNCCCMMLTNPYPVQITVPIHHLLALVRRMLLLDGSMHGSLLPYTTALHQELLCAELPTLHLNSLDLLIAVIKGVRSQLLPHAANIVRLLTEYFRRATSPPIRIKVYSIIQVLLISMGVGVALYLAQEVIHNAFTDLTDCHESGPLSSYMNLSKSASETLEQGYNRKRKHTSGSPMEQPNAVKILSEALNIKRPTPLSVKIAALRALEALLTVGGSLRSECWRSNVDSLLINVAISACDAGWANEGKYPNLAEESSVSKADFQLAALEALLASLLSPAHVRPPYLSQGLELFRRGKQETGTRVAAFCAHALLALEILIHPRALPLINAPGARSTEFNDAVTHQHQKLSTSSISNHDLRTSNDVDDIDYDLYNSWFRNNEEPAMDDDVHVTKNIENPEQSLKDISEEPIIEKNLVDRQESGNEANNETCKEPTSNSIAEVSKEDMRVTSNSVLNMDLDDDSNVRMERGKGIADSGSIISLDRDTGIGPEVMEREKGNVDSNNILALSRDTRGGSESLRRSGKDRMMQSYDSDSTSLETLPEIVDSESDMD